MIEDEMLRRYIKDIGSYPLIDAAEEKRLSDIIHKSDSKSERLKAKENLVTSNLRLVIRIAVDYYNKIKGIDGINITVMDLIQAGNIGLMRAADLFRSEENVKFSTYAHLSIERHIKRVTQESRLIRIPTNSFLTLARLKDIDDKEEKGGENRLTDVEIRKELGGVEQETLDALRKTRNQIVNVEDFGEFLERIDPNEIPLIDILNQRELREYLLKKINELRPLERWTVFYRFFSNYPMTLEEVGNKFGVSKEIIRKYQISALKRLKVKIELDRSRKFKKGDENEHKDRKNKSKPSKNKRMVYRSGKSIKKSEFLKKLYGIKEPSKKI